MTNGDTTATRDRLEHFPITFFATTMGLGGLALALRAAFGAASPPFLAALAVTAAVFLAVVLFYLLKLMRHPAAVAAEWRHPVRLAFFPTVTISALILATAALPVLPGSARLLWIVGMAGQGVLTLAVVSGWIGSRSFQHGHVSPAWFIPAVGNVIVPIAGAELGWIETGWLFFSAGMIFWLVLLALVFNRLIFHDPLPGRLQPTLVILIAPPAVAYIAWVRMTGGHDAFGHILLSLGYVFAALVATQLPRILRLPFALSFWALSFPVAALSVASLLHGEVAQSPAHHAVGLALLAGLSVLIALLVWRTLRAVAAGQICQPE
ncbi:SLAC1 anion channel family protein [Paracoccus marinaquae]|uniref:SLAC1 anion channel family protein n=1 Tax=Paracoccus marinaquae TaxID=2841926 RepID=A0ABS6AE30_9RHOB|nr:SLAC1 anion channel family protein [Paracoccus marinaquae]MBU3028862.1 SLAC1 anion channel family protein [Paracoccus marinaquae]